MLSGVVRRIRTEKTPIHARIQLPHAVTLVIAYTLQRTLPIISKQRRIGLCLPASQPRTVVGSTRRLLASSFWESPRTLRAVVSLSGSVPPAGKGLYPRKRMILGM